MAKGKLLVTASKVNSEVVASIEIESVLTLYGYIYT